MKDFFYVGKHSKIQTIFNSISQISVALTASVLQKNMDFPIGKNFVSVSSGIHEQETFQLSWANQNDNESSINLWKKHSELRIEYKTSKTKKWQNKTRRPATSGIFPPPLLFKMLLWQLPFSMSILPDFRQLEIFFNYSKKGVFKEYYPFQGIREQNCKQEMQSHCDILRQRGTLKIHKIVFKKKLWREIKLSTPPCWKNSSLKSRENVILIIDKIVIRNALFGIFGQISLWCLGKTKDIQL